MKRILLIAALCVCSILSGCIQIEVNLPGPGDLATEIAGTTLTTEPAAVDIPEYPNTIGTEAEKLMIPIFPDEIFSSTAEENGLGGTLYQVYGTVTDITADSSGIMNTIHLRTYKGNVVISNTALSMAAESSFGELGTINESTIATLCPMPKEGELCCIFAEYQGFSEKYKTPYFIYGSTDYLTDVLLAAVEFK